MTRRILRLGLLALTLLGLAPHTPVFTDPSAPVAVDAGEEFFIALASNETTGYTWSQSIEDVRFAHRLAESTSGRVFFTAGRDLDRYVVWDYVERRKSIVA